jgi:protein-S-isoprenylcysteine O-methyltransferase Ste14
LLGAGILFKDPALFQYLLGATLPVSIYFTARIEEKEMITRFDDEYKRYMALTKMFIPFII